MSNVNSFHLNLGIETTRKWTHVINYPIKWITQRLITIHSMKLSQFAYLKLINPRSISE